MRTAAITLALTLLLSFAAHAQSALFFDPQEPVSAGETVKGLITQDNGITTLGDVYVQGTESDDLFTYWVGTSRGNRYYYDTYTTYWRPASVSYRHSTLNFQGEAVDGWIRQFGNVLDYNNFFGRDGVYYKRIIIKRNRTRNTNRRRAVIYSYFINTDTLERSDSGSPPYIIIGSADGDMVRAQMKQKEEQFSKILQEFPAFPMWQTTEFQAPGTVVVHNGAPDGGDDNMVVLGTDQLGALSLRE